MSTLQDFVEYKKVELYTCPFTECSNTNADGESINKGNERKKRNERRKKQIKTTFSLWEDNEKFIKTSPKKTWQTLRSNCCPRGLKFIPTTVVTKNKIRRQLLQDFKHFARPMR